MRTALNSPREAQDNERRQRYASAVARRLRATSDCRFSLLPAPELARIAGKWYDAALVVMNQCDPYSIDSLVHEYGCLASEEGLTLADLLQLLRLCRQVAIEEDGWREEVFDNMDALIDEALSRLRHKVDWQIPEGLNYLTGKSCADGEGEQSGQVEHLRFTVINGRDFYNNDYNSTDDHGHGTHVAGTIAATLNNNKGITGVSPNVYILAIKVCSRYGSCPYSSIANGIVYAPFLRGLGDGHMAPHKLCVLGTRAGFFYENTFNISSLETHIW